MHTHTHTHTHTGKRIQPRTGPKEARRTGRRMVNPHTNHAASTSLSGPAWAEDINERARSAYTRPTTAPYATHY